METGEASELLDIPSQPPAAQPDVQSPQQDPVQSSPADVPPTTYLKLTDEQRNNLVKRACDRIDECRTKMGLVFGQGLAKAGSWAWDRQIAQMQYDGVYDWRKDIGLTVFIENNWSMNVPKRFIRLMAAKVTSDLLGTEPYFACMPEKSADAELAKEVEAKVQDEVARSNASEVLREAVRVALSVS
jgi:hypothetical protein